MSSYPNDPGHADNYGKQTSRSPEESGNGADFNDNGDGAGSDHDEDSGKRKKGAKRRKVNHACLYCRRSHMTCDEGRPCQRWYVRYLNLNPTKAPCDL